MPGKAQDPDERDVIATGPCSDSVGVVRDSFNILPVGDRYANSAVSVTLCVVVLKL